MFDHNLREKIGRLRVEEGRTIKSLSEEFGVSVGSVSRWCHEYTESPTPKVRQSAMEELKKECEELRAENERLRAEADKARIEADVLRDVIQSIVAKSDTPARDESKPATYPISIAM